MKKILFVINDLRGGGAEKILVDTVKLLDKNDFSIDVNVLFDDGKYDELVKDCAENYYSTFKIKKYPLPIRKILKTVLLRRIKYFNCDKLIKNRKKYDYIIAFLEGPSTKVVAEFSDNTKRIAWVHIDPIVLPYSTKYFMNIKQETLCYEKYNKIVCVSSDVKKSFCKKYHFNDDEVCVALNILDNELIIKKANDENFVNPYSKDTFNLISIGRLAKQKSFDRLLQAVYLIHQKFEKIQLVILGEGDEMRNLNAIIHRNSMESYVKLLGFKENPYPYIKKADLFVCSSITEGFSTVVCESIILGTPVITTDCAGMRDIFGDKDCGMIVDNSVNGLTNGLIKILENKELYNRIIKETEDRASFFNLSTRVKEFKNTIDSI